MTDDGWTDLGNLLVFDGITSDAIRHSLLRSQYLPAVKDGGSELPPLFSTSTLTDEAATELCDKRFGRKGGWSWVELRTRRFDGLVRRMGIPHPVPYARLTAHIADHWSELGQFLGSENSQVRPRLRGGRIISMDYEVPAVQASREARRAQNRFFMVKADISNCFGSVYSHALDWALRGREVAKRSKDASSSWESELDRLVRNCREAETTGLIVGPAVSNVIAEIILQRIDQILRDAGFADFVRYVDDYTVFCEDRSAAENFTLVLQKALSSFRMELNTRKTRIVDLTEGLSDVWMAEIRSHMPIEVGELSTIRFLRHSEHLARQHPDRSVMKFALKTIRGRREADGQAPRIAVVDELIRLCTLHPHLAPQLAEELVLLQSVPPADAVRMSSVLRVQMSRAAKRLETDTVLWLLYILTTLLNQRLTIKDVRLLLAMEDDLVALAVCILCPRHRTVVTKEVLSWDYHWLPDYDKHWLVRYELFRTHRLNAMDLSPEEEPWMTALKARGVKFSHLV